MKEQNSDWRMPMIDELKTLVVKGSHPAIDAKVFPGCPAAGFWSGSPPAGYSSYAWFVDFDYGGAYYYARSGSGRVRLVRGGQDFDPLWSALDTEGRWYDCGDGLAFDRTTGLQWQRYCVGQSWVEGMPSGDPELLTWDEAMSRFGNGVPEGSSSVDEDEEGDSVPTFLVVAKQEAKDRLDWVSEDGNGDRAYLGAKSVEEAVGIFLMKNPRLSYNDILDHMEV